MKRAHAIPAALVAGGLLLSGCGGTEEARSGGKPEAAATPASEAAPTKAEYAAQLNAICSGKGEAAATVRSRDINRAIAKVGDQLSAALKSGSPTDALMDRVGRLHIQVAESREQLASDIRQLTPPSGGAPEEFLAAMDRHNATIRRFAEDAKKMDGPSRDWIKRFNTEVDAINRAGAAYFKQARALGAKRCVA